MRRTPRKIMATNPLFTSEHGKDAILRLYSQKLDSLHIDYAYKVIATTYGDTNIIVAGNPSQPPILLVHGSNGCAPIALETYQGLLPHFSVYAVDVLAQPNKSAGTRLSMKGDAYGKWMNELIDALGLHEVTLAGFSFGGLVILKTLAYDERKIKAAFLSAPAYIVNGNPLKALLRFFIPMRRYMKTQNPKYLDQFLHAAFTETDDFARQSLALAFAHFSMDFTPVPVIKSSDAAKIKTPITLIAAQNDILFPGRKMIKRAQKIFPSLKHALLLKHSKHVQNKADNQRISALIINS